MLCLCIDFFCCFDTVSNLLKISNIILERWIQEQCGDAPLQVYLKVHDDAVNSDPTHRSFRTKNYTVATYEQTKRG